MYAYSCTTMYMYLLNIYIYIHMRNMMICIVIIANHCNHYISLPMKQELGCQSIPYHQ